MMAIELMKDLVQFYVDSIVPDLSAHNPQVMSCRYHRRFLVTGVIVECLKQEGSNDILKISVKTGPMI